MEATQRCEAVSPLKSANRLRPSRITAMLLPPARQVIFSLLPWCTAADQAEKLREASRAAGTRTVEVTDELDLTVGVTHKFPSPGHATAVRQKEQAQKAGCVGSCHRASAGGDRLRKIDRVKV